MKADRRKLDEVRDEDWETKGTSELARLVGLSEHVVRRYRKRHGKHPGPFALRGVTCGPHRSREVRELLQAVSAEEWHRETGRAIAARLGLAEATVSQFRRKQGIVTVRAKANVLQRITEDQWRTLTTVEIARLVGIKQPTVVQWRQRHGKPKRPTKSDPLERITNAQWLHLGIAEIARWAGVSELTVSKWRHRHNKPKRLPKAQRVEARESWHRWALHHPRPRSEQRQRWEQSPKGKEWLQKNQDAKNERRDEWRKKRRELGLPYS